MKFILGMRNSRHTFEKEAVSIDEWFHMCVVLPLLPRCVPAELGDNWR